MDSSTTALKSSPSVWGTLLGCLSQTGRFYGSPPAIRTALTFTGPEKMQRLCSTPLLPGMSLLNGLRSINLIVFQDLTYWIVSYQLRELARVDSLSPKPTATLA